MIDVSKLTKNQIEFLKKELGVSVDQLEAKTEEELDSLYDDVADIEIEEAVRCQDSEMSLKGNTAADLVNFLCDELGYVE